VELMSDIADQRPRIGMILLAAGGSSRLGQPKQLLEWDGKPLIRHAAEQVLAAGWHEVVVVLGHEAERCAAVLTGLPVRCVVNSDWSAGMAASIRAGLAAALDAAPHLDAVIFALADQPRLPAAHLRALGERWLQGGFDRVATERNGQLVAPALFGAEWFDRLAQLEGDKGAKSLLRELPDAVATVALDGDGSDIDTAEDYRRLCNRP
jgi:molybdenum cofactor cytidylyltransferase